MQTLTSGCQTIIVFIRLTVIVIASTASIKKNIVTMIIIYIFKSPQIFLLMIITFVIKHHISDITEFGILEGITEIGVYFVTIHVVGQELIFVQKIT